MEDNPYEPPNVPSDQGTFNWWTALLVLAGYAIWMIIPAFIGLVLGAPAGAIDGTPPYLMVIGAVGGATLNWLRRRYSVGE
jgi:hypothetical protein